MKLKWTSKADSDLKRLYEFLAIVNKSAAIEAVNKIVSKVPILIDNPRLGERLE